jgi:hypothetical protein
MPKFYDPSYGLTDNADDENQDLVEFSGKSAIPSLFFDAIGECDGCDVVTNVNGYHYCEHCWGDLTGGKDEDFSW